MESFILIGGKRLQSLHIKKRNRQNISYSKNDEVLTYFINLLLRAIKYSDVIVMEKKALSYDRKNFLIFSISNQNAKYFDLADSVKTMIQMTCRKIME